METSLMSVSLVDSSHVEETVNQVLTQFVQDGDGEDLEVSVEFLQIVQEQVELHLEYAKGSLTKCQNFLLFTMCAFVQSKNPVSVHSALTWVSKSPQPAPVPRHLSCHVNPDVS